MPTTATLPPGPRARWITGHLSDFRAGPLEFLARCAREHGDFVPLRIGFRKILLVSDPAAIEEVLLTKSRDFIKHFGLQMTRQLLGNGLLTSEGEFWLRQRRLAQPAFHRDRIREYGRVMIDHTRDMLAGWRDGDRRDLVAEMMGLTLRIAAKTLFDADESGGDAAVVREQLAKSIRLFNSRFSSLIRFPLGWPTPRNLKMRAVSRRLNEIIYKYIRQRRQEGVTGRTDLLSLLLHARDEEGDGTGMTDAQLRDEVMTLFLAGQETTALALSWGWYLLCQHAAVEEQLVREIRNVLSDRPPTVDDVPRLKYAEAVILESMRLHPPAYVLGREAIRDVTVGGYAVAKGWTVFMAQSVVQRDPRWWAKPDEFRPDRWLDGSTKDLPKYAYFPFGGGPRICIGNTFAMMETVLVLAEVARRFHFERTSNEPIPPLPSITVRPTKPLDVILHAR
ncbi:MAG TPA: cytochrome P450 [Gemmataceae bacterium]|jgi:cytochrome P450|nr:cytochrome P450 [Gemmataceae bacterium]